MRLQQQPRPQKALTESLSLKVQLLQPQEASFQPSAKPSL
jgi:hypothetical protein